MQEIPYAVHEGDMARMERTIKRLCFLVLTLILLLTLTNCGWAYHQSKHYEAYHSVEVEEAGTDVVG